MYTDGTHVLSADTYMQADGHRAIFHTQLTMQVAVTWFSSMFTVLRSQCVQDAVVPIDLWTFSIFLGAQTIDLTG